jgi:hypothetical protein
MVFNKNTVKHKLSKASKKITFGQIFWLSVQIMETKHQPDPRPFLVVRFLCKSYRKNSIYIRCQFMEDNRTEHISHLCKKAALLSCHRCLIKTSVEKNELHLNIDYNFDHQMSLSKSKWFIFCYAECHYAECRYAKRRYAECCYAECHVRISKIIPFRWNCFQNFCFQHHFHLGVILIEPLVAEDWSNVL